MLKKAFLYVLAVVLLGFMGLTGLRAYENSKAHERVSRAIVDTHRVEELSRVQLKKLAGILSFGLYDGYEEFMEGQQRLREDQAWYRKQSLHYTLFFTVAVCFLLGLRFLATAREFTVLISLAALVALACGLLTPILEMTIHKEVRYLGDVVLMTESRGVLDSIIQLFTDHQYVVGGALLLFSILFPLLKTLSMLLVALFLRFRAVHGLVHLFKMLGKWSMADVFVVATFLVYLSAGRGEMSRAAIQPGFYFFLIYVILSIFASLSADQMLRRAESA